MPLYKVAKKTIRTTHQEFHITADSEEDAEFKVKMGGGIHLPERDEKEPAQIACTVVEQIEDDETMEA
jgi:hypothetical protein